MRSVVVKDKFVVSLLDSKFLCEYVRTFVLVLFQFLPVLREGNISPCATMLGLLYIQRLSTTNPAFTHSLSSKELFLASMVSVIVLTVAQGND